MTFSSGSDPAQVLKDLLQIRLPSLSESASIDIGTSSAVHSAASSLMRLSNHHGSDLLNNSLSESDVADKQIMNRDNDKQHIMLLGSDTTNEYPIYGNEVEIVASRSSGLNQDTQLSDKVLVNSVDKCDWRQQYYFGNLVAVHQNKAFVAYALKDKAKYIVKVLNCQTDELIILEGFSESVVDISFANSQDVILAAVDQTGDLRVFKIFVLSSGQLFFELLLHLQQFDVDLLNSGSSDLCFRVVWCPFVPEKKEGDSDDAEDILKADMFLAFSCNSTVRVLNVEELFSQHRGKPVDIYDLKSGCCVIDSHLQPVFDMVLSPDGTTLATASADGFVRFSELDMADYEPPKSLFEWKPHNGRPVSLLIFLDNLKNASPDAKYWKYAVTGADQNCELKLWSCETWICLQTLTFSPSPYVSQQFQVMPCIKAQLDSSASYLVLSDIMRKTLYVLRIERDSTTRISSVAEFLLVQPCIGLAIEDVIDKMKPLMASHSPEPLNGKLGFSELNQILSLYTIQTKAIELLRINLMPSASNNPTYSSDFSANSTTVRGGSELVSPIVTSGVNIEDTRNSLEIVPSESSSFTMVTSMDEGDHLIDIGSRTSRILSNSSAAAETTSRDQNPALGHRPSTELSCALAHISSIQLPIQSSLDAKNKLLTSQSGSVVSSSGDFLYSVLGSSSGATPKEHLPPSAGMEEAYGIRLEQFDPHGTELRADLDQNFIVGSYSDASLASEHQSDGNGDSPSEWLIAEPLFHDRTEVSPNKSSKEDVASSLVCESLHGEQKDVIAGVESPRIHQQPSDLQLNSTRTSDRSSPKFIGVGVKESEWQVQALEISKMLVAQRETMDQLRDSLVRESNFAAQVNELQVKVNSLEKHLVSGLQDAVSQLQKDRNELMQQLTIDLETHRQQQLQQQMQQQLSTLSQVVRSCLHTELESSIEYQMQRTVLPGVFNILDPVAKKLTEDLSQKLTATDVVLKDSVKQMVRSKTMTEVIGKVVSNNLETVLHSTCSDLLIPAFDRGCQNVLSQVNETFQKGLNMYLQQMQKQGERMRIQANENTFNPLVHQLQGLISGLAQVKEESRESLNHQLNDLIESVKQRTEELERQKANESAALNEAVNSISTQLLASFREIIHKEMSSAFKEHQATINEKIVSTLQSRSSTPAPQAHSSIQPLRTQIVGHVQRNNMNAAFQQALSAVDLSIVMFLCEMVNPDELFSRAPFPLDQPVLLSLIQQLSADLRTQTNLKCRYLEEALLNVDQKSTMMKEHLPAILEQLCMNAEVIQQVPGLDLSLKRSVKRLIMPARFLCHSLLSPLDSLGT